jgi:dTDP-4-amino-4,6-dideoxygalactose transaminase
MNSSKRGAIRQQERKRQVKIPLSSPDITDLERQAVQEVLTTRHLALGPKLSEFEDKLAARHNRRFAIAVNSGTSALHLGMLALGLKPGEEVITTPFSFIASTNCILYVNGTPRFTDIDPDTWNLDLDALEKTITPATRGILPVHVFGLPCDMKRIGEIASRHGLWILEDACEAIGAHDGTHLAGSAADVSVLAFYPNKQMTTGEGGALLTDDPKINDLCRSLRNQGRGDHGGWLYHVRLGYNYRLSDINAALGSAQLDRLDELLAKRAHVAQLYNRRLCRYDRIKLQAIPDGMQKSWFVYVVALEESLTESDRDRVIAGLTEKGVGCNKYFTPIHLQPFLREQFGFEPGNLPHCESLSSRTIALPFHGNLSEADVDFVCKTFIEIVDSL